MQVGYGIVELKGVEILELGQLAQNGSHLLAKKLFVVSERFEQMHELFGFFLDVACNNVEHIDTVHDPLLLLLDVT